MRISDWSSDVCSSRIAETRVRKLHAQPWKHAQLDIAKREFAAGFLLNLVLDLAAIVVRIKQQRDRDQRGDDEQHKAADDAKNDFQRLGHEIGRTSCRERVCKNV